MSNDISTIDVSAEIEEWIETFNTLKGWETLTVPKPVVLNRRGTGEKFRSSPESQFEQKLESAGDQEELEQQLESARKSLADLKLLRAGTQDPTDLEKLEEQIEDLVDSIKEHETNLEIIARVKKQLDQLQRVEGQLPQEVQALQERLSELRVMVETKAVDLKTVDQQALQRFRDFHDLVAKNIESARQEVMSITTGEGESQVTRNYAMINSKEYKLLYGMLEEAILTVQLGKVDGATRLVQQASDKLFEYRTARTGAQKIERPDVVHPELDEFLYDAERMIDSLRRGGFAKSAEARRTALADVTEGIRAAVNSKAPDIIKRFLPPCGRLLQQCKSDVTSMHRVQQLLAEAGRDVVSMRANGHEHRPGRIEKRIAEFAPGADMDQAVSEAVDIRKQAARLLEECMSEDVKRAKIDPNKLRQDLEQLKSRYDDLFKHEKDGTVKTQRDRRTGQEKGVKKNRDLPRQTIEEIELRIKAAEQLLNSDSVDALRDAERYIGNVGIFLDNIDSDPSIYKSFEDRLTTLDKKLKKVASKYALYEVSQRSDLQFQLDKLRKEYMTKPQAEVERSLQDQSTAINTFKELVSDLRSKKRALEKQAERIEKALNGFGETLKKSFSSRFLSFDGYYGPLRDDLGKGRAMLERRTKDSLDEAEQLLHTLEPKVGQVLMLLKPYKSDPSSLKPGQLDVISDFLRDAKNGQTKHNDNLAQKDTFEEEVKRLKNDLKTLKELIKKLKGDPSEREALETELESLEKTTSKEQSYLNGVEELKPLAARLKRQLADARGATQIVDATLGDAAHEIVSRVGAFQRKIVEFYDTVVRPAGEAPNSGNQLDDQAFDADKIKKFFSSIVAAIPQQALGDLKQAARTVGSEQVDGEARKLARKTALAAVRSLSAVFEGFKPIDHLRVHPFDSHDANELLSGIRLALPRIEIRLLTAIQE